MAGIPYQGSDAFYYLQQVSYRSFMTLHVTADLAKVMLHVDLTKDIRKCPRVGQVNQKLLSNARDAIYYFKS